MAIALVVRKTTLHEANDDACDLAFWLSRPMAERIGPGRFVAKASSAFDTMSFISLSQDVFVQCQFALDDEQRQPVRSGRVLKAKGTLNDERTVREKERWRCV